MESITWSIDKNSFENIFKDLIKILKQRGENTDKFEKLFLNISDLIPTKFPELMDFVIKDKEDITQSEKDTLSYVLWHTLSVFYKKTAEIFNGIDYKTYWTKAICPLCGNLPKMSRLNREDGKRILACFLCWTEWLVPRISCAYCGNNSQDTLEYFYANGNKVYRVDICKVCNKYIKTIDEKLLGRNVNLEIEDNITYHLDTLAISKGYKNPFL